jgi:[glutamine synthetase] adenylyltransferase / [glutamine synthetase]-adenylyl-L-tyrosine phosphorylase
MWGPSQSNPSGRGADPPPFRPDPSPLLLASRLPAEDVAAIVSAYRLTDVKRADVNLQSMAGEPRSRTALAAILKDLLEAGAATADPDQALTHWDRFVQTAANRTQLYQYLAGTPRVLHLLATVFGNSPYLAETIIRDPLLVYWLAEEPVIETGPSAHDLERELRGTLTNVIATELKWDALRRFKRRQMLRIGVRDLLRVGSVPDTTDALSSLAAALIQSAYDVAHADLRREYGQPMHRDRHGKLVHTQFTVIAMGKLGGGELNFSSDVDLIYVYESEDGQTRPVKGEGKTTRLSSEEYFEYLARGVTRSLSEQTHEGSVFRVDLRLRAEGSVGQLARSLGGYRQYYRTRGQWWERQALLKAWPIAGDRTLGLAFLRMIKPFIFGRTGTAPDDERAAIQEIKDIKAMIDDKIAGRGDERRNVKLGIGGIREIEFLVQAVQMVCGRRLPGILDRNTLGALARFRRMGLLSEEEAASLTDAYVFLRDVEHKLQMVHDLQTHAIPESRDERIRCAVRLGYPAENREQAMERFLADHRRHTVEVNRMFRTLVDSPDRSPVLNAALRKAKRS